jgi:peptide/nickel transport system substrate-binding protein
MSMQRAITPSRRNPSRRDRAARLIGRGHPRLRTITLASAAILALTTMSACHSASTAAAAELPSHGGTLNVVLSSSPIVSLDPQEISLATDANISRMINRTLTTTNSAGQLVPDLATDTGRPSDNNTVWEFTLKPGVKWQDGSLVTCQDVQYGVERRYAPQIDAFGGLPYPKMYLKDNPDKPYAGPYVATDSTLQSIVCVDKRTVQFHLQRPVGDFGYTVSVNTFAAVKAGDKRTKNDPTSSSYAPFANGPYKVDPTQTVLADFPDALEKEPMKTVLVRNPFWDPGTDAVRKAYPDKIVITFNDQKAQLTNDLITSTGSNQFAINLDSDVTPNFVQQVINDPLLSKRAVAGDTGAVRYFAINMRRMTIPKCRQALEYGFDKRSWRFVLGGSVFGQLATSMIPPSLPAHEAFDLYETNTQQDGDYGKARDLWKANGCPPTITAAFPNVAPYPQLLSTVVTAYQRLGVQVKLDPIDAGAYYQVAGDPNNKDDIILGGWIADWPNGSAVIPPLYDADQVTAALKDKSEIPANLNLSELVDPTIEKLISQAYAEPDLTTQYHLWGEIDKAIMTQAVTIPIIDATGLRMMGTKVRGAVMSAGYGEPDLATLGVVP